MDLMMYSSVLPIGAFLKNIKGRESFEVFAAV